MDRLLICEPLGGMGNRMLSIMSCLVAAKQTDRAVLVVWPDEAHVDRALRLHHLWQHTGFEVLNQSKARKWVEQAGVHVSLKQSQRGPKFSVAGPLPCVYVPAHGFIACEECRDREQLKPTFEQHFKLADKLQVEADEIRSKHFRHPIFAAYVRAGRDSHSRTKKWNPKRHFVEFANSVLSRPENRIFLACDCPRVAEEIRQEFPSDRVIIPEVPKTDSLRGWQQAAINAHLCLAADDFFGSRVSVWTNWISILRGDARRQFLDDVWEL